MLVFDTRLCIEVFQLFAVVQVTIFVHAVLKRLLVDKSVAMFIEQFRNGVEVIVWRYHSIGHGVKLKPIFTKVHHLAGVHQVQVVHVGFGRKLHTGIVSDGGFVLALRVDGADNHNAIGSSSPID